MRPLVRLVEAVGRDRLRLCGNGRGLSGDGVGAEASVGLAAVGSVSPSAGTVMTTRSGRIAPSPFTSGNLDEVLCSSSVRCRFGGSLGEAPGSSGGRPGRQRAHTYSVYTEGGSASNRLVPSAADVKEPGGASAGAAVAVGLRSTFGLPPFATPGWPVALSWENPVRGAVLSYWQTRVRTDGWDFRH